MKSEAVYRQIRSAIEAAEPGWREGEEIAGENQLAEKFHVARATLRAALKRLADDGFLTAGRGKRRKVVLPERLRFSPESFTVHKRLGTVAETLKGQSGVDLHELCRHAPALQELLLQQEPVSSSSFGQSLRATGLNPHDTVLQSPKTVPCHALAAEQRLDVEEICKSLNIKASDPVIWFLRLRSADHRPLALQWCVIPERPLGRQRLDVQVSDLVPGGLTAVFERFGIRRFFATATVRPRRPSAEDAHFLRVDTDAPLIEERRVSYVLDDGRSASHLRPYEFLTTLYTARLELLFGWMEPGVNPLAPSRLTAARTEAAGRKRKSSGKRKR